MIDTFAKLSNNNKNKRLPTEEQDNKITDMRSPSRLEGEQGQKKISKHPPVDPMRSPKK